MNKRILPWYMYFLPFGLSIFIYTIQQKGIKYAIKQQFCYWFVNINKWLIQHSKKYHNFIRSRCNGDPYQELIFDMFVYGDKLNIKDLVNRIPEKDREQFKELYKQKLEEVCQ